jgi:hypothetical protein
MTSFCRKKGPPPAKGLPVYPINQIAAFNSIGQLLNGTFRTHRKRVTKDFQER